MYRDRGDDEEFGIVFLKKQHGSNFDFVYETHCLRDENLTKILNNINVM